MAVTGGKVGSTTSDGSRVGAGACAGPFTADQNKRVQKQTYGYRSGAPGISETEDE